LLTFTVCNLEERVGGRDQPEEPAAREGSAKTAKAQGQCDDGKEQVRERGTKKNAKGFRAEAKKVLPTRNIARRGGRSLASRTQRAVTIEKEKGCTAYA